MSKTQPSRGPRPSPKPPEPRRATGIPYETHATPTGPGGAAGRGLPLAAQAAQTGGDDGVQKAGAKLRREHDRLTAGVEAPESAGQATASMLAARDKPTGPTMPPRPDGGVHGAISDD